MVNDRIGELAGTSLTATSPFINCDQSFDALHENMKGLTDAEHLYWGRLFALRPVRTAPAALSLGRETSRNLPEYPSEVFCTRKIAHLASSRLGFPGVAYYVDSMTATGLTAKICARTRRLVLCLD